MARAVMLNTKILLLTLVLLPGAGLMAQQPDDSDSAEQQAGDASNEQVGSAQGPGAGQDESDPDTPDAQPDGLPDIDSQPIDGAQSQGPGRFIPSEQISQDFGVSFPVDI